MRRATKSNRAPKKRPPRKTKPRKNRPTLIRLGTAVELRYRREIGKKRGYYKHEFTTHPGVYYNEKRNEIVLRGD